MAEKISLVRLRDGRARLTVRGLAVAELPGWMLDVVFVGSNLVDLRIRHDDRDDAPPITATGVLRRVSPEQLRRRAYAETLRARIHGTETFDPDATKAADGAWRARPSGRRQTWTPERLVEFIARYDELLNVGAPDPYAVLIDEWGLGDRPSAARGAVRLATTQGLWEPAGKGRRGGKLTPKAKRLLRGSTKR